jgi:hypothetical protein
LAERVQRYYRRYGEQIVEQARERCIAAGLSESVESMRAAMLPSIIIERAAGSDLLSIDQHGDDAEYEPDFSAP